VRYCKRCGKEVKGRGIYCSRTCANRDQREIERAERKTYTVWSCGGGVQSTAIAALIYTGKIPKPDYSVMVDTGYEKTAVMDYVRTILIPRMAEVGVTLDIVKTSDYCQQSLIDDKGYCIIPVFKKSDSGNQKLRTCCNDKWKVNVIRKWLLENGVEQYDSIIGISTDEAHRKRKAHKKYYSNTYPLIDLGIDRDECIRYITQTAGWPEPPRSSCFICGQQTDGEWWRMAVQHPEDFKKAVEVERALQQSCSNIYLHRGCKSLEVTFKL
jgi:hypothetical protein